jgi:S-methylmethionine-dependent homocysteine/selenocysteine methylase
LKAAADIGHEVKVIASIGPYATNFRDASEYTAAYIDDPNVTEEVIYG